MDKKTRFKPASFLENDDLYDGRKVVMVGADGITYWDALDAKAVTPIAIHPFLNPVRIGALIVGDGYLAEDGYSGIADGENRYVIPTNGFEPGYHQGEGNAWLVNAKGEKAPGYEEPQTVRETSIRLLNADERQALRDVVEGRVTFEDFERRFEGDDLEP